MATTVPAPILDGRNGDLMVAEAIGSLPSELSDRSDSNPAVVIIEAVGAIYDQLVFQLNNWPKAVIQKVLNLVGITLNPAVAATVQQTFTLTAPQVLDTVIPLGTQISTNDGTVVFATVGDLIIPAYTQPSGTISFTLGSTAVSGSGTTFLSDVAIGSAISVDGVTWYTVAATPTNTSLTLLTPALSTVSVSSYKVGAFTSSTSAQCTVTGLSSNVAVGALTALVNQPAGVASTVNNAAAVGGSDQETVANALLRAPQAFASRDVACAASDYEYFAVKTLGANSRAKALANNNAGVVAPGYVTTAVLAPGWSVTNTAPNTLPVLLDLQNRTFVGSTTIVIPANIDRFDLGLVVPACSVWRKSSLNLNQVMLNVASAFNNLLNPNTYNWGRTIYTTDLVQAIEAAVGVDRVHTSNGVPCVGLRYQQTANAITFTNGSSTATANAADIGAGKITKNKTFIFLNNAVAPALVTDISGTTLTLDGAFQPTTPLVPLLYYYVNVGDTVLSNAWTLPFSNINASAADSTISGIWIAGSVVV